MRIAIMFFLLLSITGGLFAQNATPKNIAADLLKSYRKILFMGKQPDKIYDRVFELGRANTAFINKLKYYTSKYPFTISQGFPGLVKEGSIKIIRSSDGLFRIYSWDNQCGDFDVVMQYKYGGKTNSSLVEDTVRKGDEGYVYPYRKLYTVKTKDKTYYVGVYDREYSRQAFGTGVRVFAIENGLLDSDVKIIKTTTGLHSSIGYDFNVFSTSSVNGKYPGIHYNDDLKTLYIPIVSEKEKFTGKFITYKFTGKYFEKVK